MALLYARSRQLLDGRLVQRCTLSLLLQLDHRRSLSDKPSTPPGQGGGHQLEEALPQTQQMQRLQGTLAHLRRWASKLQAAYQASSPEAAKSARQLFVFNLPPGFQEADILRSFNELLAHCGGTVGSDFPLHHCRVLHTGPRAGAAGAAGVAGSVREWEHLTDEEGEPASGTRGGDVGPDLGARGGERYALLEFCSVEEASNAMALDRAKLGGSYIRVRRPRRYDRHVALLLGPTDPNPAMDLSQVEFLQREMRQTLPQGLYVGGLRYAASEEEVKQLLLPFGTLKHFRLVMDPARGNSKGYAFVEYEEEASSEAAVRELHGKFVGGRFLRVVPISSQQAA